MFKTLKSSLQVLFGIALVVQLTGCFFSDHDHHHDYDHHEHHDDAVDVHLHG